MRLISSLISFTCIFVTGFGFGRYSRMRRDFLNPEQEIRVEYAPVPVSLPPSPASDAFGRVLDTADEVVKQMGDWVRAARRAKEYRDRDYY